MWRVRVINKDQVERYSVECRKYFCPCFQLVYSTTLYDWLAELVPLFHPMRSESKPIVTCLHAFSRAWRRSHLFASSSDWFIALLWRLLWLARVILWFCSTTLDWKPFYSSCHRQEYTHNIRTWNDMPSFEVTWRDVTWHDMTWHDITSHHISSPLLPRPPPPPLFNQSTCFQVREGNGKRNISLGYNGLFLHIISIRIKQIFIHKQELWQCGFRSVTYPKVSQDPANMEK